VGADEVGGTTGAIDGCGSAGILAALPLPLGSRIEPLVPLTFPGPGGMPLTPASWAGDLAGAATRHSSVRLTHAILPITRPREKTETARRIDVILSSGCRSTGRTSKPPPKFPSFDGGLHGVYHQVHVRATDGYPTHETPSLIPRSAPLRASRRMAREFTGRMMTGYAAQIRPAGLARKT
jgi:hypothetical protein